MSISPSEKDPGWKAVSAEEAPFLALAGVEAGNGLPKTVTHRQRTEELLAAGTGQRHRRKNLTSVLVPATCQVPPAVGHTRLQRHRNVNTEGHPRSHRAPLQRAGQRPLRPAQEEPLTAPPAPHATEEAGGRHTRQWGPEGVGLERAGAPRPEDRPSFQGRCQAENTRATRTKPASALGGAEDSDRDSVPGWWWADPTAFRHRLGVLFARSLGPGPHVMAN